MALFFAGTFTEPLDIGHVLVISGRTTPNASRIDFNIAAGKNPNDFIGFHISARMDEKIIVRNSYSGDWGPEDRFDSKDEEADRNPIKRGKNFQIYILVCASEYNLAIDETPYCTFPHRLPFSDMKAFTVYFDAEAITAFDHRRVFPSPYPSLQIDYEDLVFSHDYPNTPSAGDVVIISAVPIGSSNGRLEIQLNQGTNSSREVLRISIRFDEDLVIFNDCDDDGSWGEEESDTPEFPFQMNQLFRIAIAFGESSFRIAINGIDFYDFEYRTDEVLEDFTGFSMECVDDLKLLVRGVDHMRCSYTDCEGFHIFSHIYDPLISNV